MTISSYLASGMRIRNVCCINFARTLRFRAPTRTPQKSSRLLVQCLKHADENTADPACLIVGACVTTPRTISWKLLAYCIWA